MIEYIRVHSRDIYWVGATLLISVGIQIAHITRFSFWHDESFTALLAGRSIPDIIAITATDVHPPLYYVILHVWTTVLGSSDVAIRALSIVFLLAALVVLYRLMKRFINPGAARWGVVVAAVGPFTLRYGIEARMYTLAAFLLVSSTWFLLRYLEAPSKRRAVLYTLSIAALLYTHYFTFPVVFVHGLFLYRWQFQSLKPRWAGIKRCIDIQRWWVYSMIGVTVLFAPWLPVALTQTVAVGSKFWMTDESLLDPLHTLIFYQSNIDIAGLSGWQTGLFIAGFAVVGGVLYSLYSRYRHYRDMLWLLAAGALIPPILILGVSLALPESAVYVDRYFSYFALFWYGLLGLMLWLLGDRPVLRYVLLGIIAVQFTFGIYNLHTLGNYNWNRFMAHDIREAMQTVSNRHEAGEKILVADSTLYTYYDAVWYNRTGSVVQTIDPGYNTGNASLIAGSPLIADMANVPPGSTVWLIVPRGDEPETPSHWRAVDSPLQFDQATVQKYEVTSPRRSSRVGVRDVTIGAY